jgi:PKHD-type hydroxylase
VLQTPISGARGLTGYPTHNDTQWVFETLGHVVSSLNAQFFGFDLLGFGEQIQLTNYDGSEQGMYGWHVDMGPHTNAPCRKLSIVVQLSDPVDYEGGVLELQPSGKDVVKMRKQRGLVVAFPSWTLHQVTPVTQGNRQSLVAWISGPPFK